MIFTRTFKQSILLPSIEIEELIREERVSATILVVYEDDAARERAMRAVEHLVQSLSPLDDVRSSWWSLKSFFHPRIMKLATDALRKADIILFSISTGGHIPLVVRAWLEAELGDGNGPDFGLLALLENGVALLPHPSPARAFLHEIARKTGVDFLASEAMTTNNRSNLAHTDPLRRTAGREENFCKDFSGATKCR